MTLFIKRGVSGKHQDKENTWLSLCHIFISRVPLPVCLVWLKTGPNLQPNVSTMCSVFDCLAEVRGFPVLHVE